jgi:hypothetical protein
LGIVLGVLIAAMVAVVAWQFPDVREAVNDPPRQKQWATERPFSLRQVLLDDRDAALARDDLVTAAAVESKLGLEAMRRIAALQAVWMRDQDKETRLFSDLAGKTRWTYRNTAADFFCFLVQATLEVAPGDVTRIAEAFDAERSLDDETGLPISINVRNGKPLGDDREEQLFGTSEYLKDGLLSVFERFGPEPMGLPIGERMKELTVALMEQSLESAEAGPVSGQRSEEVGNTLQICNRLAFAYAASDPEFAARCAEYAAGVTEAVLFEMLPANHGLPAREFDFDTGTVVSGEVWFRDHGNEFFPGLAESYAHAVSRLDEPEWAERAERWAPVLVDLYDVVFEHGLNENGLIVNHIDPATRNIVDGDPSDNWGYVLNGVLLFTEAAKLHGVVDEGRLARLEAGVDQVVETVAESYGIAWEPGPDGYYDAIESALYLMHHRPATRDLLGPWVDDQIGNYFDIQQGNGLAQGTYLDGNFIRTTLLYADWKRGGFRVKPWRRDVAVGLTRKGGRAVLIITAMEPYEGTLVAAEPWHRTHMRLPWDWPRLNSWPEHLAADGNFTPVTVEGSDASMDVRSLRGGVPIRLGANGRLVAEWAVDDVSDD